MKPNKSARWWCLCRLTVIVITAMDAVSVGAELLVSPAAVILNLPDSSTQLVVSSALSERGALSDRSVIDRTHQVEYRSLDPAVAIVQAGGNVVPRGDGQTRIIVSDGSDRAEVPVIVDGFANPRPVSFRDEILPILNKAGCNATGCHGKKEGQNGFHLSVFGRDPLADYQSIVLAGRGRRIAPARPADSLFLLKAAGIQPHGGGSRIDPESTWYQRIKRWIGEGAPFESDGATGVARIEIEPEEVVLSFQGTQQIRVIAVDGKGQRRCVTVEASYESNMPPVADTDKSGRIDTANVPGEAGILIRYMGQVGVCRVTVPQPDVQFERPPENNFIDRLVWDKLEQLGVAPSEPADDGMFLRRVYLDTTGTLPTTRQARDFLEDTAADKRQQLVDTLLEKEEYAVYWAMRWADLLKVDTVRVGPANAVATLRWLRQQFRENTPYDQFVRAILVARGNSATESPAAVYQGLGGELGPAVSQLFLGVRIECAQCHQHPSEKWNPNDYYAFGGFFTGMSSKGTTIFPVGGKDLENPRTKETIPTAALGAAPADFSNLTDRRKVLADWMTAPDNPFFARLIANRLWAHYFGRGLFDPVDDLRATNPAANEPLLDALTEHLRELDYDLKAFTRTLLLSRAYALSSIPNETNIRDQQNFSHAMYKPMPAEVLVDAISQVTGVPDEFNGWPQGYRAVELWDNRVPSYFFEIFGRPKRLSVCECERGTEPSISQALYLLNSPEFAKKIRHRHGLARGMANSKKSPREIIDELYLATLSRFPNTLEQDLFLDTFSRFDRREASEDILWTLLNTKRFLYVH